MGLPRFNKFIISINVLYKKISSNRKRPKYYLKTNSTLFSQTIGLYNILYFTIIKQSPNL